VQLVIAEFGLVHFVPDLWEVFLHDFLADNELSEIDDLFDFVDDLLVSHLLQEFVELHVFEDQGKANCLACLGHQMFQQIYYISRVFGGERLHVYERDFAELGLDVGWNWGLFEDVVNGFFYKIVYIGKGCFCVGAIFVEFFCGLYSIKLGVDNTLEYRQHFSNGLKSFFGGLLPRFCFLEVRLCSFPEQL
jgi:hypothetical protein